MSVDYRRERKGYFSLNDFRAWDACKEQNSKERLLFTQHFFVGASMRSKIPTTFYPQKTAIVARINQSLMLSQQGDWCIMADISKIRRNNSMAPNLYVMKINHLVTLPQKMWPHRLNSERVTAAQFEIRHYTPVHDIVKIVGVLIIIPLNFALCTHPAYKNH